MVEDLTGRRFFRWTVLFQVEPNKRKQPRWRCRCDCGVEKDVLAFTLKNGASKSCGCYNLERRKEVGANGIPRIKHGCSPKRLYLIWTEMKRRCFSPNCRSYPNYGGRGISVCDAWRHSFSSFRDWALANGYAENLTINRIDNDAGYSPENCTWSTMKAQANNRRSSRIITFDGKSHTVAEWSDLLGVPYPTLLWQFNNHPVENVFLMHKEKL